MQWMDKDEAVIRTEWRCFPAPSAWSQSCGERGVVMSALRSIALAISLLLAAVVAVHAQAPAAAPSGMTQQQFDSLVDAISKSVAEKLKADGIAAPRQDRQAGRRGKPRTHSALSSRTRARPPARFRRSAGNSPPSRDCSTRASGAEGARSHSFCCSASSRSRRSSPRRRCAGASGGCAPRLRRAPCRNRACARSRTSSCWRCSTESACSRSGWSAMPRSACGSRATRPRTSSRVRC